MHTRDIRVRPLEARRVERLGCLPGSRIACLCGTAWLTLDGDPRDIVLRAGESFLVDAEAPVMACALGDGRAVIDLVAPKPRRPGHRGGRAVRLSAWSIAAVCAGFASFALVELGRALVDVSTVFQHQG